MTWNFQKKKYRETKLEVAPGHYYRKEIRGREGLCWLDFLESESTRGFLQMDTRSRSILKQTKMCIHALCFSF